MSKQKVQYLDVDAFVSDVLEAMKLGDVPAPVLVELRETIADRLADRIMNTILSSFGDKEMKMYENVLQDHKELDELDALMIISQNIDGLPDKIERNINSLYEELIYNADKIEEAMTA
ncbi:MAG: hypothetical protein R3B71_02305 [Candidatus Gracilibacteria bacterium]|nr:hypothetical protein [Candidatus Peregrinibacteria bacterium]